MEIRKAVITAAGPNQDRLPLQRFVDLDGVEKTALQIILEEIVAAGIEEVCIVVRRGNQQVYREAAGDYSRLLVFVEQPAPRGYGEALYRGAAGGQPGVFAPGERSSVHQPAGAAMHAAIGGGGPHGELLGLGCAVHSRKHAPLLRRHRRIAHRRADGLYRIERVLEKPTPTSPNRSWSCRDCGRGITCASSACTC